MRTLKNFIAGQWVDSRSGQRVRDVNPADTSELVAEAPSSTAAEAGEACEAAARALQGWRRTPAPVRGQILFKVQRRMEERRLELAEALSREDGKTLAESRGEVQRAINVIEFFAGQARRITGETIPSELPNNFCYTVKQPVGPVAVITPWNFPIAIPIWKIAPALVSGNTVVFKPASLTPTSIWRSRARYKGRSDPPVSAAPRRAGRWSKSPSPASSCSGSRRAPRHW